MSAEGAGRSLLRCRHCGREVVETIHTRSSYRVDYYALHTGDAEPFTLPRTDDTAPGLTAWRLLHAHEIVTCAECYRQPGVQEEREALFRPEVAAGEEAAS